MEDKVIEVLNIIKAFISADNGDLEYIKYENNYLFIKLYGSCVNCSLRNPSIKQGILNAIKIKVPEIEEVIIVDI